MIIGDLPEIIAVVGGVSGLFYGLFSYRDSQTLKRKDLLFFLMDYFDKTPEILKARKMLDDFYLDNEQGWVKENKRYYGRENLATILRNHEAESITDPGEIVVRESIDTILDFFVRLEYLLEVKLLKDREVAYFCYFLKKARDNTAIQNYTKIYQLPLYDKLLSRMKKGKLCK